MLIKYRTKVRFWSDRWDIHAQIRIIKWHIFVVNRRVLTQNHDETDPAFVERVREAAWNLLSETTERENKKARVALRLENMKESFRDV